jgi:hypothetical protein
MALFCLLLAFLHHQGDDYDEGANTSATSVNFYQNTRRSNTEDGHFHTCHLENLNSNITPKVCGE